MLAAVDPRVGGVALLGGHGTCKSTLARALRALLPRIETVRGSAYNADPNERTSRLRKKTNATDASVVETEIRDAPFLTIPLGATEDAVLGSVDLERSADSGEAVFSPGILAREPRRLFLDDLNLLDDAVAGGACCGGRGVQRGGARGHLVRSPLRVPHDRCRESGRGGRASHGAGPIRRRRHRRRRFGRRAESFSKTFSKNSRRGNVAPSASRRRRRVAMARRLAERARRVFGSRGGSAAGYRHGARRIDAGAVAIPDWAVESLVSRARARRVPRPPRGDLRGEGARAAAAARRGSRGQAGPARRRGAGDSAEGHRGRAGGRRAGRGGGRDEETPDVPDVPDVPKNEKAEEDAGDRDRDDQSDSGPVGTR